MITSLFASDPAASADYFVRHLGMEVTLDIGWFVSLVHPDHPETEIAITWYKHETIPHGFHQPASGTSIAVVVEDAHATHASLTAGGCPPLSVPIEHPWGQCQFFAPGPDGLLLDVVEVTAPDPQWLLDNGIG